jgi:uncharacterized protein (DUF4415 family)
MTRKPTGKGSVRFDRLGDMSPKPLSKRSLALTDDEIAEAVAADPDTVDTSTPGFWETAEVKMPEPKAQITLRVDREVLDWFRKSGKGYQTRINAVLRSYIEAHKAR